MADLKISELTNLTAADPANDMIPIVDVSATPPASGSTKRISINNILACSPTATLASATISGDLTVRTNKLSVTSTNVGIGTASPTLAAGVGLEIENAGITTLRLQNTSGANAFELQVDSDANGVLYRGYNNSPHVFYVNNSTAMTLNSTGLGVGYTPSGSADKIGAAATLGVVATGVTADLNFRNSSLTAIQRIRYTDGTGALTIGSASTTSYQVELGGNTTTRAVTIDTSGNLLVGITSGSYNRIKKDVTADAGNAIFELVGASNATSSIHYSVSSYNANAANAASKFGRDGVTLRSINAGGTINASGADYAEYMTKASDFVLAKGDIAGIDSNGKLTNVFADAVSFVVKSTDPSYVGNDKWGADLEGDALEFARQLVDRIAFAGQVPVNVIGAKAGDYIVPVVNGSGIKGIAVSNPTFEQYQLAVGKVIAIDADGRARIIVKVA